MGSPLHPSALQYLGKATLSQPTVSCFRNCLHTGSCRINTHTIYLIDYRSGFGSTQLPQCMDQGYLSSCSWILELPVRHYWPLWLPDCFWLDIDSCWSSISSLNCNQFPFHMVICYYSLCFIITVYLKWYKEQIL